MRASVARKLAVFFFLATGTGTLVGCVATPQPAPAIDRALGTQVARTDDSLGALARQAPSSETLGDEIEAGRLIYASNLPARVDKGYFATPSFTGAYETSTAVTDVKVRVFVLGAAQGSHRSYLCAELIATPGSSVVKMSQVSCRADIAAAARSLKAVLAQLGDLPT